MAAYRKRWLLLTTAFLLLVLSPTFAFANTWGDGTREGQTTKATEPESGLPCKDDPCCPADNAGVGVNSSGEGGHSDANAESSSAAQTGLPIHLLTGRKLERVVDMVVDGVYPIRVTRMYDSQSTYDSPLGYGWSLNFFQGLYKMGDDQSITVRTGCGTRDRYNLNGSLYELSDPESGRRPDLVELPASAGYELTAPNNVVSTFDVEGRLRSRRSAAGHEHRFSYQEVAAVEEKLPLYGVSPYAALPDKVIQVANNYRLERVEEFLADGNSTGRFITLGYDADSGRLITVTSYDGRVVSYDHTEPTPGVRGIQSHPLPPTRATRSTTVATLLL